MNRRHVLTTLAAILLATTAAMSVRASELDVARLPADAMWVVHLDVNAALRSRYAQLALADMQATGLATKLDAMKNLLGLDPLKDFDSITAFGKSIGEQEGTILVQMGPGIGKLEDIAKLADDYQLDQYKQYVIHSWIDKQKGRGNQLNLAGHRVYCAVVPRGDVQKTLLVFSADRDQVIAEINQLDSAAVPAAHKITARPSPGSILFAAAMDIDQLTAAQPNRPAALNVVRTLTAELGESEGNAYLSLQLGTTDAQQAANLQQMAAGLLALVKMNDDPAKQPLADLAAKINITVNDSTVNVRMQYPSNQLYELVKKLKAAHDAAATPAPGE